nr:MAG TPA: hypothetical protein [Caudoviricetes sp.]
MQLYHSPVIHTQNILSTCFIPPQYLYQRDFPCGKVDLSSVIIYYSVGIVNSYTKLFKGMGIWLVMKN